MLKLRQSPVFGGLLIVLGIALLVLASMLPDSTMQMVLGIMNTLIGVLILTNPVVLIDEQEIQIRNLLGITMRRVPHGGIQNLEIQGKHVYVKQNGETTKVKSINKTWTHPGDWKVMAAAIDKIGKLAPEEKSEE